MANGIENGAHWWNDWRWKNARLDPLGPNAFTARIDLTRWIKFSNVFVDENKGFVDFEVLFKKKNQKF